MWGRYNYLTKQYLIHHPQKRANMRDSAVWSSKLATPQKQNTYPMNRDHFKRKYQLPIIKFQENMLDTYIFPWLVSATVQFCKKLSSPKQRSFCSSIRSFSQWLLAVTFSTSSSTSGTNQGWKPIRWAQKPRYFHGAKRFPHFDGRK